MREPAVRALFCEPAPSDAEPARLAEANSAQLPAAEQVLDGIAAEAVAQARQCVRHLASLLALLEYAGQLTRQ